MPDDLRWNWCNLKRNKWVSEVALSCLTLCDPMNCSLPGCSVHGILQARVLEWVAISFSNRNKMHNTCNALESAQNHPSTPGPWKNCLSQNQFLMPKRLGTAALGSAPLNLLPGSKRNKRWRICEDEGLAEAQSHSRAWVSSGTWRVMQSPTWMRNWLLSHTVSQSWGADYPLWRWCHFLGIRPVASLRRQVNLSCCHQFSTAAGTWVKQSGKGNWAGQVGHSTTSETEVSGLRQLIQKMI